MVCHLFPFCWLGPSCPFSACIGFKVSACLVNCCQLTTIAGSVLDKTRNPPLLRRLNKIKKNKKTAGARSGKVYHGSFWHSTTPWQNTMSGKHLVEWLTLYRWKKKHTWLILHITVLQTSYLTDPHCEISVFAPTKENKSEWLVRWLLFTKIGMTLTYPEPLNDSYWSNIRNHCVIQLWHRFFSLPSYFEPFGAAFFLYPVCARVLFFVARFFPRSNTCTVL